MKDLKYLPGAREILFLDLYNKDIYNIIWVISMLIAVGVDIITMYNLTDNIFILFIITFITFLIANFVIMFIIQTINNFIENKYWDKYFLTVQCKLERYENSNPEFFNYIKENIINNDFVYIFIAQDKFTMEFSNDTKKYIYNENGYKNINAVTQGVFAEKIISNLPDNYNCDITYCLDNFPDEIVMHIYNKDYKKNKLKDWC